ncbi:MAG: hypothetical protein WKF97_10645 [Chitinophagaceae bacterium]
MKHTKSYAFLVGSVMAIVLFACTKNDEFINENVTNTGVGYYPLSANTLVDMATNSNINNATYSTGATFRTEIQFISQSPVKEINLYATVGTGMRTKQSTYPYAPAYSATKGTDTLLVPFTVPTGLNAGTSIRLEYEILNQNNLNLIRLATIRTR